MGRGLESEPTRQRKPLSSFGRHCPNCEVRLAWCRPAILFEFIGCGVAHQKSVGRGAKGTYAHSQVWNAEHGQRYGRGRTCLRFAMCLREFFGTISLDYYYFTWFETTVLYSSGTTVVL